MRETYEIVKTLFAAIGVLETLVLLGLAVWSAATEAIRDGVRARKPRRWSRARR